METWVGCVTILSLVHVITCPPREPKWHTGGGGPITPSEESNNPPFLTKTCELYQYGLASVQEQPLVHPFDPTEHPEARNNDRQLPPVPVPQRWLSSRVSGGHTGNIIKTPYCAMYGDRCGAAIMSRKWLVTAAMCGNHGTVFVGSTYRTVGVQYSVCAHFIHPKHKNEPKAQEKDYDVQLLLLEHPLRYSIYVKPIRIAKDPIVDQVGINGTLSGWGYNMKNRMSDHLITTELRLLSNRYCSTLPGNEVITERMFCAASITEHHTGACQGDLGSPFVSMEGRLLGLVSYDRGCGDSARPTVFTKLANDEIHDWITGVTGFL